MAADTLYDQSNLGDRLLWSPPSSSRGNDTAGIDVISYQAMFANRFRALPQPAREEQEQERQENAVSVIHAALNVLAKKRKKKD
jgi:hypothetical protein